MLWESGLRVHGVFGLETGLGQVLGDDLLFPPFFDGKHRTSWFLSVFENCCPFVRDGHW